MRILAVEDNVESSRLLQKVLDKYGHEMVPASSGGEAFKRLQEDDGISLIITDWMMPEMNGVELCKRIREHEFQRYIYIILLTAKNKKDDLIEAMEAGADDFLSKPYDKRELNVRLRAAQRILDLEHELESRNRKLSDAYGTIQNDLEAAANIQASLLPDKALQFDRIKFDWLFIPYKSVAGDIFNFFQLDEKNIGFYLLDVSGHGISAAMLSVTVSKVLSPTPIQASPLKHFIPEPPHYAVTDPADAVSQLNERFQADDSTDQYFTMIYGIIDLNNDLLKLCQAGHPPPLLLRNNDVTQIGDGGYPVGMFADISYEEQQFEFKAGDRLFVHSDGITECRNNSGEMYSQERLIEALTQHDSASLSEILSNVKQNLRVWRDSDEFDDDLSMIAIERHAAD